jgi:hypothetical protein
MTRNWRDYTVLLMAGRRRLKVLAHMSAALGVALGMALPAAAEEHSIGEDLYMRYCAACHGETGTGGGDMEHFFNIHMPNLRTMAARNDGAFPLLETIHIIDGRTGLRAHGGPMPLWGGVFMSETIDRHDFYGSAIEARGRVLSLALYLESIQD